MKKLLTLFMILSVFAVVSSCGDSKPGDLPASQNASATKSINIVAAAGNTTTTETVFTKADFAALEKYAKWVTSGEVLTTSEIAISEITEENVELTNVRLYLASNTKTSLSLPNITGNKTFKELSQLNFLQHIINEVAKRGSSKVVLTYKTSNTITKPVDFAIKLDASFKF